MERRCMLKPQPVPQPGRQRTNPKGPNAKRVTFFIMMAVLAAAFEGGFAWVWNRLDFVVSSRYAVVAALGWVAAWSLACTAASPLLFRWMNVKYPGTLPGGERTEPLKSKRLLFGLLVGLVVLFLSGLVISQLVRSNNPNGRNPLPQLH